MKIQDVQDIFKLAFETNDSVLMIGVHGIGKTESVINFCKDNNFHLETLYLSNQEVGDLIGIPYIENNTTKWSKPLWLDNMEKANKHCVLFLDEISRAQLEVKQSCLQLVLDKKIHLHSLPKNTLIIAADNPVDDDYQVQEMDAALLDRFLVLNIDIDVNSWIKYSENNVHKTIIDFIISNPDKLWIKGEGVQPTPRSWTKISKYLNTATFNNLTDLSKFNILKGRLGAAVGSQFLYFYKNYKNIISLDEIIKIIKNAKATNFDEMINVIKPYIDKLEAIELDNYCKVLLERYIKTSEFYIPILFMNALPLEILASNLKTLKTNDDLFEAFVEADSKAGKRLVKKYVNNLNFKL